MDRASLTKGQEVFFAPPGDADVVRGVFDRWHDGSTLMLQAAPHLYSLDDQYQTPTTVKTLADDGHLKWDVGANGDTIFGESVAAVVQAM